MKIWILNHYAIPPSLGGLNRHYYFSKYLSEKGHEVKIFTSSKIHNSEVNMIKGNELYSVQLVDGIPYTFIRNSDYKGNGISRIWNLIQFPLRMWRTCCQFPKPDRIYTSSPDIFTAFAAVLYAKYKKIPCICEVRDLWPESIVAYKNMSPKNPVIWALYQLEKWIYKKADRLIFTMEGGADYIKEKGWEKQIDLSKVYHINNGVDLKEFRNNRELYPCNDPDLSDPDKFHLVYTGSIRRVNNLGILLDAAKELKAHGEDKIQFLIWGDGDEREALELRANTEELPVIFKGRVPKAEVPGIVSKADCNLMQGEGTPIMRFGCSANKLFDYFAAGKPILCTFKTAYSIIDRYQCGLELSRFSSKDILQGVLSIYHSSIQEKEKMGQAASCAAKFYDFKELTRQLEEIFEGIEG